MYVRYVFKSFTACVYILKWRIYSSDIFGKQYSAYIETVEILTRKDSQSSAKE